MACSRRSLTSNFTLLTGRLRPSFSPLLHHRRDDDRSDPQPSPSHSMFHYQTHADSQPFQEFHNTSAGFGALVRERRGFGFFLPLGLESPVCRYSSRAGGSKDLEYLNDVADVLTEKSVDGAGAFTEQGIAAATAVVTQVPPVAGEVAAAAADSAIPVAALQYVIDGVHSFTGLDWWLAISLTTALIRTATIPLLLHQIKTTSKLSLMKPHLEEIKEKMQNSMDPQVVEEGQRQMKKLFKQYGVSPFTPLKGLFIQGPIFVSFFMAISNMAEKVPSFNNGGAFWFTDLTTPDTLYLLPVLTSLTFLATVELNMQEGMEGNPMAGTMKKFFRVLALFTVPLTASFPKAIFCYWITSNLFSLVYGLVLKNPPVRKFLNLPEIVLQAATAPQPGLSIFGESKLSTPASSSSSLPSDLSGRRVSSSSVISQRIRNLEKSVKGRNKGKKR